MNLQEIALRLRDAVDDTAVVSIDEEAVQPGLTIDPDHLAEVALVLRDEFAFDRLLNVSGVDHEGYDHAGKGKHRKIAKYGEDGTVQDAGDPGTGDLGVVYHMQSRQSMDFLVIKVRMPRETPHVQTVSAVWPTANWGERETFDMYGIIFDGHPDLRRLLLPEDWEGYPLRKDYQMPARYHDVPLEGLPLAVRDQREPGGGAAS